MIRMASIFVLLMFCASCAIPTPLDDMTLEELHALPDNEICSWARMGETNAVPEAHRRGLACADEYERRKAQREIERKRRQALAEQQANEQRIIDACGMAAIFGGQGAESVQDCIQKQRYYDANPTAPPIYRPAQQQAPSYPHKANECGAVSVTPIASPGCKYICIDGQWAEVC